MGESYITAHQDTHYVNGVRFYTYTFRWEGSKYKPAYISYALYRESKDTTLNRLPWPVKIVEDNLDFGRGMMIIRKDVGMHVWWIAVYLKRHTFNNRPYQHLKWRVIMTFDIWGLGYQPEGEVISWRNIGRKRK